ncbi:MAG: AAA family ATPase [Methylococcales bacterium]|nr:AAA family ATPase [Methylococcales bacterium]
MHTFKNFKNFADVEIDLSKPMTLLIGRNGSGKSNLIEGVQLSVWLMNNVEPYEITDIERGNKFEVRGGIQGCFRQGHHTFEIGFKDEIDSKNVRYVIQVNLKPEISQESSFKPIDNVIKGISSYLAEYDHVFFYDFYPQLMRQYSLTGLKQLSKNGANISSVLYHLQKNTPDILQSILERIKELPEESFVSFEFITTSDDSDVLFALKYPNGEVINAKLLSDGTLRALAILTALETVFEGSRVIIEEIDNGIHASRTQVLLNAIWETSHRRNLKTLITTHNSATLDGLEGEQLSSVVICHYDKETQSAKLTPFFELPHVEVLLQKGNLGGLVTRNVIEQYLDPKFEEKRQEKMQSWLESIE